MNELIELVGSECEVLLLEPAAANTVKLSWPREGEGFSAYFALPQDTAELVRLLGAFGLVRMPKPISRIVGRLRPNTRARSMGSALYSTPKRGISFSQASRCAGEKRP